MSLVAFGLEEQVQVCGETLTLRLDFRAITGIEGALERDLPTVAAVLRSGNPPITWVGQIIWFMLREYHRDVTLDQVAGIMFSEQDGGKLGIALNALLDRAFPVVTEDKKPKNAPKRRGRSRSSAAAG